MKKLIFLSILVYVHWKSAFWVRPCLKTSLWRHTSTDFHDFGINGKRRPYPIPWYQTIILWARQFQVHKRGGNHPHLVNHVTKKGLIARGLNSLYFYNQPIFPGFSAKCGYMPHYGPIKGPVAKFWCMAWLGTAWAGGRSAAPGAGFCGQNLGIKYIPCVGTHLWITMAAKSALSYCQINWCE